MFIIVQKDADDDDGDAFVLVFVHIAVDWGAPLQNPIVLPQWGPVCQRPGAKRQAPGDKSSHARYSALKLRLHTNDNMFGCYDEQVTQWQRLVNHWQCGCLWKSSWRHSHKEMIYEFYVHLILLQWPHQHTSLTQNSYYMTITMCCGSVSSIHIATIWQMQRQDSCDVA